MRITEGRLRRIIREELIKEAGIFSKLKSKIFGSGESSSSEIERKIKDLGITSGGSWIHKCSGSEVTNIMRDIENNRLGAYLVDDDGRSSKISESYGNGAVYDIVYSLRKENGEVVKCVVLNFLIKLYFSECKSDGQGGLELSSQNTAFAQVLSRMDINKFKKHFIDYVLGKMIVEDDLFSYGGSLPRDVEMWKKMLSNYDRYLDQACHEGADLFSKLYNKKSVNGKSSLEELFGPNV